MKIKKNLAHGFIYIILIILLIICILPFYVMIINSTHSTNELYVGLQILPGKDLLNNLSNMAESVDMVRGFLNSFIIAGSSTLLAAYFGTMTAYGIFEYRFRVRKVVYSMIMVSMMVPTQLSIIGLFRLSRNLGLLDTYWPIILPSIANAGTIFFVLQYLETTMDEELLDSARIDGCGEISIFHRFILPLAKPGIATMAIFNFVSYWNNFFTPMILLFSDDKFTVPLLIRLLLYTAFSQNI